MTLGTSGEQINKKPRVRRIRNSHSLQYIQNSISDILWMSEIIVSTRPIINLTSCSISRVLRSEGKKRMTVGRSRNSRELLKIRPPTHDHIVVLKQIQKET